MPDTYETMTPREIDAQIAERLFGAQWIYGDLGEELCLPPKTPHTAHSQQSGDGLWLTNIPRYSKDAALLPSIVEAMGEKGWWLHLRGPWSEHDADYFAGFTPLGATGFNGRPDHTAHSPALMHALCLAALRALDTE